MSKLRQSIATIENDIDILLKTIHGKDSHQVYKDSPTKRKLFSADKKKYHTESAETEYESRHNYAKDTFNSKIHRLNNDYKRAYDKFSEVPTKGKRNDGIYNSNFSSKNSRVDSADRASAQQRVSTSTKKVPKPIRRPSTSKNQQNWKVN